MALKENDLIGLIGDILHPPVCPICGDPTTGLLCSRCRTDLSMFKGSICQRCGKPVFLGFDKRIISNKICILCKDKALYFKKARIYSDYNKAARTLISKYRSKGYKTIVKVIEDMFNKAYRRYYADHKIDYIDTHREALYEVLSRLSDDISLPFGRNIVKTANNKIDPHCPSGRKERSLQGYYKVKDALAARGKDILLIDDAAETGEEVNSISLMLKRAGARSVYLLTAFMQVDRDWL